jgi:hypothetical protein
MEEVSKNINHLLISLPRGAVVTSSWLVSRGVSHRLQHHHSHSSSALLENIGVGAYIVKGNDKKIEGALYAMQSQLSLDFHIGALSALGNIHNIRHFITMTDEKLQIFTHKNLHAPAWFTKNFEKECRIYRTQFLTTNIGIQNAKFRDFELKVSSIERAILEAIFLSNDNNISLKEIAQMIETMTNLRPVLLQQLLECCSSIRVKRIFLCLADHQNHAWFKFIDISKIDLGAGKRVISPFGKLDKKYLIVIDDLKEI